MYTAKLIDFVSIMALIWVVGFVITSIAIVFDRINGEEFEICPIRFMVFIASAIWLFVFKF